MKSSKGQNHSSNECLVLYRVARALYRQRRLRLSELGATGTWGCSMRQQGLDMALRLEVKAFLNIEVCRRGRCRVWEKVQSRVERLEESLRGGGPRLVMAGD